MAIRKNSLGGMMAAISKDAGLSAIYTNHCIRATCITLLDESGYEGRHIIGISKHKSETSLKHYATHLSESKKHEMSNALVNKILPQDNVNTTNMVAASSMRASCTNKEIVSASCAPVNVGQSFLDLNDLDFLELPLDNLEKASENTKSQEFQSCSFNQCSIVVNKYYK
jgi:hypothetical protein